MALHTFVLREIEGVTLGRRPAKILATQERKDIPPWCIDMTVDVNITNDKNKIQMPVAHIYSIFTAKLLDDLSQG